MYPMMKMKLEYLKILRHFIFETMLEESNE